MKAVRRSGDALADEVVKLLLCRGADPMVCCDSGKNVLHGAQRQAAMCDSRWCLRVVETVSGGDDRECSGEPQDTCESFELSIVRIGLETTEL